LTEHFDATAVIAAVSTTASLLLSPLSVCVKHNYSLKMIAGAEFELTGNEWTAKKEKEKRKIRILLWIVLTELLKQQQ
ncbi:hypothetical protein, partial [Bacillus subtilis]|uniref:hypothetical protein n=1 Tax=Bacillus subtilis TaxID=1423 RepID=UPI003C25CBA9